MRKQHRIQLAFVVLLIVTAFPHQYLTQDSDINHDPIHNGNNTTFDKQTLDDLRKTNSTRATNYDILTNKDKTTDGTNLETDASIESLTSLLANKVSKKSESERKSNEEELKMGSGKKPMLSNTARKSITTNRYERPHKVVSLRSDDDEAGAAKFENIVSGQETVKELGSDFYTGPSKINVEEEAASGNKGENRKVDGPEQREIDDAVEYGLERMRDLYLVKEPELYKMGMFLEKNHPGFLLASFRTPNEKALNYARYGYAALQARTKLAEVYPESISRESPPNVATFRSDIILEECPLQGIPRCPPGFERYRTADGTCNNFQNLWRGASMLPMQRFLPPHYDDGIQTIRRSVRGVKLPSPRDISTRIHRDKNREVPTITSMFMQWGQFLDHDITSSAQARMFNRSVPRCCQEGGVGLLPPEFTHPECLPIPVSKNDWFLSQFGIRCIEFVRSAPTSRIDCDLGWREQISQVTAYIDGSTVYGSDPDTADSLRLFKKGQLVYGRSQNQEPLQPPDPPEGELCRLGAITTDCFRRGDLRVGDQPGLTALHTVWVRYHNRLAIRLGRINSHWSDEKVYQETRRIIGALIQHITYREFLPIILGQEVMKLFDLDLERTGYYKAYNPKINPAPANSFGSAAFRFGHSLVQHSFVRTDTAHRIIRNSERPYDITSSTYQRCHTNTRTILKQQRFYPLTLLDVTLHEEQENVENIWSFGSMDRLLLGLCNQPTQRRDEFISAELTNHLFQSAGFPFGMDLASINIQRGRDHGIPSYTAWREPCGLVPLRNWTDLERIMSVETVRRFKSLYAHFDDIDLFSGGLAEKPVRGGIIGPTFACIIAQQFSNLRKGDRFWYENDNFESSFTPAQLQQIRRMTLAHVLCKTMTEIDTLQPFVFLSADNLRNARLSCDDPIVNNFDLTAWEERTQNFNNFLRKADDLDENIKTTTPHSHNHDGLLLFEDYDGTDDETDENEGIESRERPNKKRRKTTITRKVTTTKSTITRIKRPSAYINNHAVSQTAYKPFKVKLTNLTTSVIHINPKKKPVRPTNVAQKRPLHIYDTTTMKASTTKRTYYQTDSYYQGTYQKPTRRPTLKPDVDGYLIDYASSSHAPPNTIRPKPIKTQTDGPGPYHVNINIQFVPPDGQAQTSNVYSYNPDTTTRRPKPTKRQPTKRPTLIVDSYNQNEQDYTKRPDDGYSNFVTKRPSYSYNRPESEYGNFHYVSEPTNMGPVYRPTTDHETVFEDVPFATSNRPYHGYNNFDHKIPTMKPVIIPSYLYLNDHGQDYDSYQQPARPTYNRRPTNGYKTEDHDQLMENTMQQTYSQMLSSHPDFDPNQDFFTIDYKRDQDKPDSSDDNSDETSMGDFDEMLPSKLEDEGDKTFVKISSIQGHKITTLEDMKQPVYISVQQREGDDMELLNNNQQSKDPPLLQVDIVPSEIRTNEWTIYNEIDGIAPVLPIFDLIDLNGNISCANEIPKPMKLQGNNITTTAC